ncbi:MAG TPA: NUDIX domain-containing protein [Syntrophorhabdaceae bacterium]|nr:NUDIX domain-containing protein [Syntrophorhabdaceae bacterium]
MPKKTSAGILAYRQTDNQLQVLLVHPGGPFWTRKDEGAWSIPKGEFEPNEDQLDAAIREFFEETGYTINGNFIKLDPVKQPSGKTIYAFAVEKDLDIAHFKSNTFAMEWPRGSGIIREFPEIDRVEWFMMEEAKRKILKGQCPILLQLVNVLNNNPVSDILNSRGGTCPQIG